MYYRCIYIHVLQTYMYILFNFILYKPFDFHGLSAMCLNILVLPSSFFLSVLGNSSHFTLGQNFLLPYIILILKGLIVTFLTKSISSYLNFIHIFLLFAMFSLFHFLHQYHDEAPQQIYEII